MWKFVWGGGGGESLALSYLWLIVTFKNIFQDRKLEKEFTLDENNFLKLGIFQEL